MFNSSLGWATIKSVHKSTQHSKTTSLLAVSFNGIAKLGDLVGVAESRRFAALVSRFSTLSQDGMKRTVELLVT